MVCGMRLRMCGAGDRLSVLDSKPLWCLIYDTHSVSSYVTGSRINLDGNLFKTNGLGSES